MTATKKVTKPTNAERTLAERVALMLTEPEPEQLIELGLAFDRMLSARGRSRRDWIADNYPPDRVSTVETQLSHVFAGRRKSVEITRRVCQTLLDNGGQK